jgi:hypothetical protein
MNGYRVQKRDHADLACIVTSVCATGYTDAAEAANNHPHFRMPNIIYVLTNEAMPGLVKIGLTTDDINTRVAALSSASGIPLPFECYFAAEVDDCVKLEKILHQLFSENRVNPKREFFRVEPERVILAISIGNFTEVTPGDSVVDKDEQDALEKIKARRPRIKLDALGIKAGDTLTFSRDENIVAIVQEGGRVSYCGETLSPSAAALKALHALGYKTPAASGSEYWMYDGELLDERRKRLEAIQFDEAASDST